MENPISRNKVRKDSEKIPSTRRRGEKRYYDFCKQESLGIDTRTFLVDVFYAKRNVCEY